MEKKLAPHISSLLYDHDCVIVPGFGGFVANYQGAKIHPTQHTFSPPSKKIAFNRSLQNNDGLLANQLVWKEKLSYPEANEQINSAVNVWNKTLETNKKLNIENIGTLLIDVEKNLRFEPSGKVNYLLDSFGLTEVQSPPIKRDDFIREQLKPKAKEWESAAPSPEKSWLNKNRWKVAASFIVLFGVAELTWMTLKTESFNKNTINFTYLNPFSDSSIFHKKSADLEKLKINTQPVTEVFKDTITEAAKEDGALNPPTSTAVESTGSNDQTSENTASTELTKADLSTETKVSSETVKTQSSSIESLSISPKKFFVVAGCFQFPENADKLVASLKIKGYNAAITGKTAKGLTMVVYDVFDHRHEAVGLLQKVKSSEDSTAWIFRN